MRIKLKGYLFGTVMGLSCLSALTPSANASTLNISDGNGTGPFGTVTLTQITSTEVGVDVTLNALYKFVDTGSHDTFGFNITGDPAVTLTNFSTGFGADNGFSNGFSGPFAYSIACTGCGPGGSAPEAGPLDFDVTVTSGTLSVSDFIANAKGYTFAADVIGPDASGKSFTGLVETTGTTTSSVPEPVSLSLVGGGLLALGVFRKRLAR